MDRSRDFFYPVAVSDQIGSAPIAASLLGERLALVRLGGELVAFRDLCVHRGTPLSMGRVEGDLPHRRGNVVLGGHGHGTPSPF